MKKNFTLLLSVLFCLSIVSCQKGIEGPLPPGTVSGGTGNNNGGTDITGTWKLISVEAKTSSTNEVTLGGELIKTVTESNYVTENSKGTVTFDASKMTSKDVSYDINTISKITTYENGVLLDTLSLPMSVSVPASSGAASFIRIGSDSLYFQSGSLFMGGTTQDTQAGGAKIKLEQDKLYLEQTHSKSTTISDQGATMTTFEHATVIITMQR